MDYEQKYKRALAWMQSLYPWLHGNTREEAEKYFPELKESEDERIRKELIHYFSDGVEFLSLCSFSREEIIAWLEKQGETTSNNGASNLLTVERAKKNSPFMSSGLENESEDKVEPKFHEGDWVVTSYGKVNQVFAVGEDGDEFTLNDGTYFSGSWKDDYHHWTIDDAKDGDVLVYGDNPSGYHVKIIMLFKSMRTADSAFNHFHIFDDEFRINDWCDCGKSAHPATKEERDLLFSKMREAGYEWDAEKKELKKIEQQPAESRQETKPNGGIVCEDFNEGDGCYKVNLAYLSKSQVELIENLVASWQNPTNNTAVYGEEDKKKLNRIYTLLAEAADKHAFSKTCRLIGDKECVELQDFLRSLKPQPRQEWSEEDEEYLNFVIATMKTLQVKCTENEIKHHSNSQAAPYYAKVINWLKSLRPVSDERKSE